MDLKSQGILRLRSMDLDLKIPWFLKNLQREFALAELPLSADVIFGFANMLAFNSTLEIAKLRYVCPVEKEKVCSLFALEFYAGVFKRIGVVWPEELLPELNVLIRRQACCPVLCVSIASSFDERVL
ncbi:hypothetical protein MTO96_023018 [Rhipicephalus appendiculatus]